VNDRTPSVIVGVDPRLTEGTEDALALASVVATATATGARVHLLSTYPWSAMAVEDEDMLRSAAQRALARARELVDASEVTLEAIPGRRARSRSRHLLHAAACPLVIVPPGAKAFTGGE
jgi:hypothetical protein